MGKLGANQQAKTYSSADAAFATVGTFAPGAAEAGFAPAERADFAPAEGFLALSVTLPNENAGKYLQTASNKPPGIANNLSGI